MNLRKVRIKRPGVPGHEVGEVTNMVQDRALSCIRDGLAEPVDWKPGEVTNRMLDARRPGVSRAGSR